MTEYQTGGPVGPISLPSEDGCTLRIARELFEAARQGWLRANGGPLTLDDMPEDEQHAWIAAEHLDRIAAKAIERGVELEREVERLEGEAKIRDEQLAAADRVIDRLKAHKGKTVHRHRCSAPTLDGGHCRRPVLAYGVKCRRHV